MFIVNIVHIDVIMMRSSLTVLFLLGLLILKCHAGIYIYIYIYISVVLSLLCTYI